MDSLNRGVAQLVAHLFWEQGVGSSNLLTPTIKSITYDFQTPGNRKCGATLEKIPSFTIPFSNM